ncbi:MAG: hypothetical protein ABI678_11335 [Kofleriaceae bacterium]
MKGPDMKTRPRILLALALALAASCTTETTTSRGATTLAPEGTADPGAGECTLDLSICAEKPADTAACEALVTQGYELCVRAKACTTEVLAPAQAACGDKPSDPTALDAFIQCLTDAQAAYDTCVGADPGTGPNPGGGTGP